MDENFDEIKWTLKKYGQEHLLNGYDNLDEKKKKELLKQINNIDFELIKSLYENTKKTYMGRSCDRDNRAFSRGYQFKC